MKSLVEIKNFTHTVFKNEDVIKYLSKRQRKQLCKIQESINKGRLSCGKKHNHYYVCNTDEPYANEVIMTILQGELIKG